MSNLTIESTRKLNQLLIEESYSKTFIKGKIRKDIEDSLKESDFNEPFQNAVEAIEEYRDTIHTYNNGNGDIEWTSKNARIDELFLFPVDIPELVTEIFTIVLPMSKPELVQNSISRLAGYLKIDDYFNGIHTAAELIAICQASGLYEIYKSIEGINAGKLHLVSRVNLAPETVKYINQTLYLPPMSMKPQKLTKSYDSPFLTIPKSSLILKNNHHKHPINLHALNCANNTPLAIDLNVIEFTEESKKPLDTKDKQDAFEQMQRESTHIYNQVIGQGNLFYLAHKYDFRGRMYSQGYHVNEQGTAYKKAIINFNQTFKIKDKL